jgi:hypothetical protein
VDKCREITQSLPNYGRMCGWFVVQSEEWSRCADVDIHALVLQFVVNGVPDAPILLNALVHDNDASNSSGSSSSNNNGGTDAGGVSASAAGSNGPAVPVDTGSVTVERRERFLEVRRQ